MFVTIYKSWIHLTLQNKIVHENKICGLVCMKVCLSIKLGYLHLAHVFRVSLEFHDGKLYSVCDGTSLRVWRKTSCKNFRFIAPFWLPCKMYTHEEIIPNNITVPQMFMYELCGNVHIMGVLDSDAPIRIAASLLLRETFSKTHLYILRSWKLFYEHTVNKYMTKW